jgi:hypothetical protein
MSSNEICESVKLSMDYIKQLQCKGFIWFFKHAQNKDDC